MRTTSMTNIELEKKEYIKPKSAKVWAGTLQSIDLFIEELKEDGRSISRLQAIDIAVKDFIKKYKDQEIKI